MRFPSAKTLAAMPLPLHWYTLPPCATVMPAASWPRYIREEDVSNEVISRGLVEGRGGKGRGTHMLQEVQRLMQVDGRRVGPRVAELWRSGVSPRSSRAPRRTRLSSGPPSGVEGPGQGGEEQTSKPDTPHILNVFKKKKGPGRFLRNKGCVRARTVREAVLCSLSSGLHAGHRKAPASEQFSLFSATE